MMWQPVSGCGDQCRDGGDRFAAHGLAALRMAALGGVLLAGLLIVPLLRGVALRTMARTMLAVLGIRVVRRGPTLRPGSLVVANHVSWLDGLALLTVVPGVPVAKAEIGGWPVVGGLLRRTGVVLLDRARVRALPGAVAAAAGLLRAGTSVTVHPEGTTSCGVQLGRFRPAFFQAAVDAAAPVCPVAVRYRVDGGAGTAAAAYLGGESLRRSLARVLATRGLVVEVHLLPALDPAGADRRELAALAEYAIAEVTEARPPVVTAHPRLPRVPAPAPVRRPARRPGVARAA